MRTTALKIRSAIEPLLAEAGASYTWCPLLSGQEADERLRIGDRHLLLQYHAALTPNQLPPLLRRYAPVNSEDSCLALVVRRLTWSLLESCRQAGAPVFDLEGNGWLKLPGVFIERLRPSHKRKHEPTTGTVFSAKATRIVRAFLYRYPHDYIQSEIAQKTGLSPGYVSVLVRRLINQGYVSKRLDLLYLDDPERLLNDWLAHYRFDRHRKLNYAISSSSYEMGVEKLGIALSQAASEFAWTGWTGAYLRAPYATPSTLMAYVSAPPKKMPGVFPVEKQGNVVLYLPQDEGVFHHLSDTRFGKVVSDAQLYLDLSRMPGRASETAEAFRHQRLDFARKVT